MERHGKCWCTLGYWLPRSGKSKDLCSNYLVGLFIRLFFLLFCWNIDFWTWKSEFMCTPERWGEVWAVTFRHFSFLCFNLIKNAKVLQLPFLMSSMGIRCLCICLLLLVSEWLVATIFALKVHFIMTLCLTVLLKMKTEIWFVDILRSWSLDSVLNASNENGCWNIYKWTIRSA